MQQQIKNDLASFYNILEPYHKANLKTRELESWKCKQDLLHHPQWPLLQKILIESSESYLEKDEFLPRQNADSELYNSQLNFLQEEYESKKLLLEEWIHEQGEVYDVFDISMIRKTFLEPMNVYYRQRIESVHHYNINRDKNSVKPLEDCMFHTKY
jgi:hypothetical protein